MNINPAIHEKFDQLDHSRPLLQKARFFNSLRSRAYIFNSLVFLYLIFITVFFFSQREQPLEQLTQFQKIQQTQDALLQVDLAAFHVVTVLFTEVTEAELKQVIAYFSTLKEKYQKLYQLFPEQADSFRQLEQSIPQSANQSGQAYLQEAHLHLAKLKNELDRLMKANQSRMTVLVGDYRRQYDTLIIKTLVLGIFGLLLIGTITTLFFIKLKLDLLALLQRTTDIVKGYRGQPLPLTRKDELGQLTSGINSMSEALAKREKDLEIERRKIFFQEKMIAVDSLAGGLAHEVGNSVSCIGGLAREISEDKDNRLSSASLKSLVLLQDHTEDLAELNRNLSLIDTQHDDINEWVDINAQLTNIINLIHFDKRWSAIKIELDLDHNLPALFMSVNQFNQLITHLLENAFDALVEQTQARIQIRTSQEIDEELTLIIEDNGSGISDEDLTHIFEPFFTTKSLGKGTGIGLAICWTIVNSLNGNIQVKSRVEEGTELTIHLPTSQPGIN